MIEFQGPKTINDTYGNPQPYPAYVTWLERRVLELEASLALARSTAANLDRQLDAYRQHESRRYRYERDYVPGGYDEDEYDR